MADYGVTPAGFVRKPLAVIKRDIEARLRTQFGSDLVLSPQSPMGQLVGVMADYVAAEVWEVGENVYQSFDVDQAEGVSLDYLGRLRSTFRNGRSDEDFRRAISNAERGSIDVQDINAAVAQITGVTYSAVFVNNGLDNDERGLPRGRLAVVVEGGEDSAIANAMRLYVRPGTEMFGNAYIDSVVDGYCQSYPIVRPISVPVTMAVVVRTRRDQNDCPPASLANVEAALVADWQATRQNGRDVSFYTVRQVIESRYPGIEVVSVNASRPDTEPPGVNATVEIDFTEIADVEIDRVSVAS